MYAAFGTLERYAEKIEDAEIRRTVAALVEGLKKRVGNEVVLISEIDTAFEAAGLADLSADFKARINDLITDSEIQSVTDAIRESFIATPLQYEELGE